MKYLLIPLFSLILLSSAIAEETQEDFLKTFVLGKYHLLGKSIDSEETYYGKVELKMTAQGIRVYRIISGTKIVGTAVIEKSLSDKINVLRIRFEENDNKFEETCVIAADLNNYARITCYLYKPGIKIVNPGLEAWFIDQGAES